MLYISVIPCPAKTELIFSWLKNDDIIYEKFAKQVLTVPKKLILKYLKNLFPLYCENMAIGPKLWNEWDENARNDFITTIDWGLTRNVPIGSAQLFQTHRYDLFLNVFPANSN